MRLMFGDAEAVGDEGVPDVLGRQARGLDRGERDPGGRFAAGFFILPKRFDAAPTTQVSLTVSSRRKAGGKDP